MKVERLSRLEWQPDGRLMCFTRKFGSDKAVTHEVDVPKVVGWIAKNGLSDIFALVNTISPESCNWVLGATVGGKSVQEKDYTRVLWGVTPRELKEFILDGQIQFEIQDSRQAD